MNARKVAAVGAVGICFLALTPATEAAVLLVEDNFARLCQSSTGHAGFVSRGELARLMLIRAGVPEDLEMAGRKKARESAPDLPELAYVAREANRLPFGPEGAGTKRYEDAQKKLRNELGYLADDLAEIDGRTTGPYRLVGSLEGNIPGTDLFFGRTGGFSVSCHDPKTAGDIGRDLDKQLKALGKKLRVARSSLGLLGPAEGRATKLKSIKPAEISFENNVEGDATVFAVNAAAGYVAYRSDDAPSENTSFAEGLIFLEYKRQSSGDTSKAEDIHLIAPGALWSFGDHLSGTPFTATVAPNLLLDLEQSAEQLAIDGTLDFSVDLPGKFTLGAYGRIGRLLIRPDLKFKARVASVLDAGESEELAEADDYGAVGAIADLQFRMPSVKPLENFTLGVSFDHLQFVIGDINRDNANRFETSLSYSPAGFKNLAVSLSYANGEDMNTYQREELYKLTLGLRF